MLFMSNEARNVDGGDWRADLAGIERAAFFIVSSDEQSRGAANGRHLLLSFTFSLRGANSPTRIS
jgi:3-phenylpropionate/cinnamic acid dioxygenase small subunit